MYDFHSNSDRYFQMQKDNCKEYVIPFIEKNYPLQSSFRVLEIGCGEGGVLCAFLERGCRGVGVELDACKLQIARQNLSPFLASGQGMLISKDIYWVDPETEFNGKFDVVVLKDVIEHIHDQERLMAEMQSFLKPGGLVFFGFPPWQMPFGGHQQISGSKFLSRLPYFHLLPKPLYKSVLKAFGENPAGLVEIKETGISIERFEKMARKTNYEIVNKCSYFINPIYKYKFNMKERKQSALIQSVPFFRNFVTTSVFYLLRPLNK